MSDDEVVEGKIKLSKIEPGQKFDSWEVLEKAPSRKSGSGSAAYWKCRCLDCKRIKEVGASQLRRGLTHGCGCRRPACIAEDLTDRTFDRWTVLAKGERTDYWTCRCQCGTVKDVSGRSLRKTGRGEAGGSRSCGCYKVEVARALKTKHGLSHTPTWHVWWDMIARCYYPCNQNYERYGGRGIRVCARWMGDNGFVNFYADMGERPADHSIDRTDNNGHYTPGNCTWQTRVAQMANTRRSHHLTLGDRTLTVIGWSRETGIPSGTILYRLKAGWTVEDALTTPVREMEACVLTHAGKTQTLTEWSEELGVPYQTLYARIGRKLAVWQVLAEAGLDGPASADSEQPVAG